MTCGRVTVTVTVAVTVTVTVTANVEVQQYGAKSETRILLVIDRVLEAAHSAISVLRVGMTGCFRLTTPGLRCLGFLTPGPGGRSGIGHHFQIYKSQMLRAVQLQMIGGHRAGAMVFSILLKSLFHVFLIWVFSRLFLPVPGQGYKRPFPTLPTLPTLLSHHMTPVCRLEQLPAALDVLLLEP